MLTGTPEMAKKTRLVERLKTDLDTLPLARPHRWLDLPRYMAYNSSLGIQTKRGCALKCTYCAYNRIEGSCYRLKSVDRVLQEVDQAIVRGGASSIEFVDSTFNIPLNHCLNICRGLAEHQFKANFLTMGINPGVVTEELFDLLLQANFSEVSMTPETASPTMLESLGKGFTVEDIRQAAALARKSKLPIMWYFMFGGPGETEQTAQETFRFIDTYVPKNHLVLLVSGIRILKGAPLEAMAKSEGQLADDADMLVPVFYKPIIEHRKLYRMFDDRMKRHPNYISMQDEYVPQMLLRTASTLHRFFRSKRPLWQYLIHLRRLVTHLGLSPRALQFKAPKA